MGIQLRPDRGAGAGTGRVVGWDADGDESDWDAGVTWKYARAEWTGADTYQSESDADTAWADGSYGSAMKKARAMAGLLYSQDRKLRR